MSSEAAMRLVDPVVLAILRAEARARLLEAAKQREAFIRGNYSIHDQTAKLLEAEAAAIEKAIAVIEALAFQ
jgi:hypothetical protein